MWIIDFGVDMPEAKRRSTRRPSSTCASHVKPYRATNARGRVSRPVVAPCEATTRNAPGAARASSVHRYACSLRSTVSSSGLTAGRPAGPPAHRRSHATTTTPSASFTRASTSSGRAPTGAQLREASPASRYTPTTCFETFPFPDPTPEQRARVGEAARRLVELRDGWLNPPGLDPADLEKRTLTNLYNQRPTWLANAHADLDGSAVDDLIRLGDPICRRASALEQLLELNRCELDGRGSSLDFRRLSAKPRHRRTALATGHIQCFASANARLLVSERRPRSGPRRMVRAADERDLAIKMNTGAGKTLVGLLILQSCLNEHRGPALYVTPSPYLAEQVTDQAALLGVACDGQPRVRSLRPRRGSRHHQRP